MIYLILDTPESNQLTKIIYFATAFILLFACQRSVEKLPEVIFTDVETNN